MNVPSPNEADPVDNNKDSLSYLELQSAHDSPAPNGVKSAPDSALQYAYEDGHSSDLDAFATPTGEPNEPTDADNENPAMHERPSRLNYIPHMTLRGHKGGVAQVWFSPDGQWIASCSADATVKIWSAKTGALVHTFEGHLAGISTIAWSPESRVLASGSDDKLIRLWDVQAGKCLPQPLIGHHNYVYSVAFSPKGNMLVSGSYDEAVFLWDVRTSRLMRSLPAHSDPVSGVGFVRDGTLIVSCSSDGLIRIWDTGTGQCLKTLVHEDNASVTSVQFSPNGKYVLAATLDSSVRLWNYVEGRCVKTYQGHENSKFSVNTAFGSYTSYKSSGDDTESSSVPQWACIACGSEDGRIVLWDVSSKEILQELRGHEGVVLGVDFCSKTGLLVSCGADSTVRVWKRAPLDDVSTRPNGSDNANEQLVDQNTADHSTPAD